MKDVTTVFVERIEDIQRNLHDKNYSVCGKIAHDLVKFSWNLELVDEVFISEVMEDVFTNLEDVFSNYDIPKEVEKSMQAEINKSRK